MNSFSPRFRRRFWERTYQAEPADAIFYVQKGKVKLMVVSKQGKEAVIGLVGVGDSSVKGAWAVNHDALELLPR